ncbi:MAG: NAD(P)/FAD-dependent oxidoreductase [Verrucomicrobiota bacterium]|nr:NAD(P)/FAD-dependent oxidoreductase [Verrucomicrobiota bacterium]
MKRERVIVVGGGAAGFFAAIACARENSNADIAIYEKTSEFLTKVRISGGGRCNVTHACFEPRAMSANYPRGERELIAPLHRFDASDTVGWFEARGVKLKTEADGRIFPVTDQSATIVDCLVAEARDAGVQLFTRRGVSTVKSFEPGGFELTMTDGEKIACDRLCLATGGCRNTSGAELARSLGHSIEPPVPSLFSFQIAGDWLRELPGVSADPVEVSIPGTSLRERGPLLVTHNGVSGPAILRLSAWGARILRNMNYHFTLHANWLPDLTTSEIENTLQTFRTEHPKRLVANLPMSPLPARLWEQLASAAGIPPDTRFNSLRREAARKLASLLARTEFQVTGKSLNKDEFVTCGGVRLREVNLKTMESRISPGLYFAGELLDIDGITGGFNFQSAWTSGWIAGNAMAAGSTKKSPK